jgi:hypothetical protein
MCRVRIEPAAGNASQYEAVVDFSDQIDNPPPAAPTNLISPWEAMRPMIPASARQPSFRVSVVLGQIGATHRLMRDTADEHKYMDVLARSLGQGQWVWVSGVTVPTNPNTGTVSQVTYVDATTGRAGSECANRTGGNVANWTIVACPPANSTQGGGPAQPFGSRPSSPQGSPRLQCNEQGKNCRPAQ